MKKRIGFLALMAASAGALITPAIARDRDDNRNDNRGQSYYGYAQPYAQTYNQRYDSYSQPYYGYSQRYANNYDGYAYDQGRQDGYIGRHARRHNRRWHHEDRDDR